MKDIERDPVNNALRFKVLYRDRFACVYCGSRAAEAELHVDHVRPVAAGGKTVLGNLVTSCSRCNQSKKASTGIKPPVIRDYLVGHFFHILDAAGYASRQGLIEAEIEPDGLAVRYFDWFTGSIGDITALPKREVFEAHWRLYDTDEDMRYAYDYLLPRRPEAKAPVSAKGHGG